MRNALLLLAFASTLGAQITALCTPESLASNTLGIRSIGIWDCPVINRGSSPRTIRIEEVLVSMPQLHRLNPARAQQVVNLANSSSVRSRLIRALGYMDLAGPALTGGGYISVTVPVAGAIALAGIFVHRATENLIAQQPDLAAYAGSGDEITLAAYGTPGYAVTLTLFASLMKGAKEIGPVIIGELPGVGPPAIRLTPGSNAVPTGKITPVSWIDWVRPELLGLRDSAGA